MNLIVTQGGLTRWRVLSTSTDPCLLVDLLGGFCDLIQNSISLLDWLQHVACEGSYFTTKSTTATAKTTVPIRERPGSRACSSATDPVQSPVQSLRCIQVLNPLTPPTISHFHQIPSHLRNIIINNQPLFASINLRRLRRLTSTSQSQLLSPTNNHQNDWRWQVRRQGQRLQERAIVSLPCSVHPNCHVLDASCRVLHGAPP